MSENHFQRCTPGNCEGHQIVARIWKQLGDPTFEQLAGRDIHDLIDDKDARIAELTAALTRIAAIQPGDESDCVTTARNRLNSAIGIARAAIASVEGK